MPETSDTIVAQATPPGAGALAVIRLSGPQAFGAAASFLSPVPAEPVHRAARMLAVKDGARLVDRAVAVFYRGPASYTGQDTVEISCHGSPYIIRTIMNLALRAGARPAGPGEFTLRAFLNGKLDLVQAEAVGELIAAGSAEAHRAAITQVEGGVSERVRGIKTALVSLLAELEARLDDSYEEIPALKTRDFARRAAAARASTLELAKGFEAGRGIKEGLKVVITGAPNSGKSSLLNALLGYDRAMVSRQAGTTRDTLEAELELHGFTVIFTDTAGLNARAASRLEREGMSRAAKAIARADAVILVSDASIKETASDRRSEKEAARLPAGARLIRVLNKADLPLKRSRRGSLKISARTGAGLPALRTLLVAGQKKVFRDGAQAVVTSARHFAALSAAAGELGALRALLERKEPPAELAAERLRAALSELSSILGETTPEEVLADIFRHFCVGK
ncbi:MAG: tRNA uridine-5-carboxymethylaminomethyl(34) synthesis GTPase MnmE [Elusimicrobia bacterium GWA2_61_42]|nr:MAG: tRNA uridine-5-carboxymethylaminomethyl(34) synthesis GTPase MnmE [Elusimicrobia bacterium GWA2_61_42]OGR74234.1 MAG: tRNA uridine-5-carboxymethylaminomethyl(34) synthesis GTPase MnmE [Elusimicrobia bacterium GWC2_61_25]